MEKKVFNQVYSRIRFSHVSQPGLSEAWAQSLDRRPLEKIQEIAGNCIGDLERGVIPSSFQDTVNF